MGLDHLAGHQVPLGDLSTPVSRRWDLDRDDPR